MAKNGWAKYATHMSNIGGLYLGPQGNDSNWVHMFELLVPEEEAELGCHIPNKPTSTMTLDRCSAITSSSL